MWPGIGVGIDTNHKISRCERYKKSERKIRKDHMVREGEKSPGSDPLTGIYRRSILTKGYEKCGKENMGKIMEEITQQKANHRCEVEI